MHPMIGGSLVTQTHLSVDEWAGVHGAARVPLEALTNAEVREAEALIDGLRELVGWQATEIIAFLIMLAKERDRRVLNFLRSLDEGARG